MIFPDQNSTNFPISVKNSISQSVKNDFTKKSFLKYHQFIVYKYLINNPVARGIGLIHGMGFGKSIFASAIAEFYRLHDPSRKIIVLLPKSLQANMKNSISKFIKMALKDNSYGYVNPSLSDEQIDNMIDNKYKFISLNSSNMFSQIARSDKTKEELLMEKQLKEFTDVVEKDDFLENSVLIIDEFHNLANSITNGSYNAVRLYDNIMKTKNIKLIFLTGTPVVNNPFELVPMFNMLYGYTDVKSKTTLFPELMKDFYEHFVDRVKNKIKNKNKFENRIFGLTSYYGKLYFGDKLQDGFPQELPLIVEKVHMSDEQFSRYDSARDLEKEEASVKGRPSPSERFSSKSGTSSSYRVKSRQISNFVIPITALSYRGKKVIKHIDKITDANLKKLDTYSPKFKKILNNIDSRKNQLGVFYSEFVSGEGIAIFSKVLDANGYQSFNRNKKSKTEADVFGIKIKKTEPRKTYAIISGEVEVNLREKIVKAYNSKDNIHGAKIALLLISKTGAEGLDLKNVRHIHICEPYWNMSRIYQIIARGVRYRSHVELPAKEQNVQPYIYLSDYPKSFVNSTKMKQAELTTDIDIFSNAKKNKNLIDQFMIALAESSIDCSQHESNFPKSVKDKINCLMCSPNNKPLFHTNIRKDLLLPNPCQSLTESTVSAKEILVDGIKYYYSKGEEKNQFHIFKHDKFVKGYIPLQQHEYPYSEIIQKLLKL